MEMVTIGQFTTKATELTEYASVPDTESIFDPNNCKQSINAVKSNDNVNLSQLTLSNKKLSKIFAGKLILD